MSEQRDLPPGPMTVPDFFAWVDRQPKGTYELVAGRPQLVAMAPPPLRHTRTKFATALALHAALRVAGLPCEVFTDGAGIQVDRDTLRVPDASVNCGHPADNDTRTLPDPVVVVEVLSPSTEREDMVSKFRDYFRVPSIRHYLLLDPTARVVMHHARDEAGEVRTSILGSGTLRLDPPGLAVEVEALFAA
jgi:Uma2 family endonuclease